MTALRTFSLAVCIGMASAACSNDMTQKATNALDADVVTLADGGMIRGTTADSMRAFKGIPYAAAPIGALRWKPPQKPEPLSDVLDATKFGSGCSQGSGSFGSGSTDEDCLFLNVYTPTTPGPHPVMFWIHGGAFLSGASTPYIPNKLVAQGVVVVTINYRLGVLGFLAHSAIDNGSGVASTNYGLLDQQFALRWVQDNIASFGGDESNVTIFGESAGGFSVHSQLAMQGAHGLFQKAIVESGAYGDANQPTLDAAQKQGAMFASAAHCSDPCTADALRGLSASDVLAAQQALNLSTLIPAIDGTVIPNGGVGAALSSGAYEKVPVIEGSNHDEWALFVALYLTQANVKPTTQMDYETAASATLGVSPQIASALTAQYPLADYSMDPAAALTAAGTDVVFACPSRAAAIQFSADEPTYVYEFSDEDAPAGLVAAPPADPEFKFGAAHGSEVQYIWNLPTAPGQMLSSDQQALSKTMVDYWTQFAKTGDPNFSGGPSWPKYSATDDAILTLNTPATAVQVTTAFKTEHKCQ